MPQNGNEPLNNINTPAHPDLIYRIPEPTIHTYIHQSAIAPLTKYLHTNSIMATTPGLRHRAPNHVEGTEYEAGTTSNLFEATEHEAEFDRWYRFS